jgi:hypothetical protein
MRKRKADTQQTGKKGASKGLMVVKNDEDDSDSDADCPDQGKLFSTDKSG